MSSTFPLNDSFDCCVYIFTDTFELIADEVNLSGRIGSNKNVPVESLAERKEIGSQRCGMARKAILFTDGQSGIELHSAASTIPPRSLGPHADTTKLEENLFCNSGQCALTVLSDRTFPIVEPLCFAPKRRPPCFLELELRLGGPISRMAHSTLRRSVCGTKCIRSTPEFSSFRRQVCLNGVEQFLLVDARIAHEGEVPVEKVVSVVGRSQFFQNTQYRATYCFR